MNEKENDCCFICFSNNANIKEAYIYINILTLTNVRPLDEISSLAWSVHYVPAEELGRTREAGAC